MYCNHNHCCLWSLCSSFWPHRFNGTLPFQWSVGLVMNTTGNYYRNFTPYYQKLPENEWRLSSYVYWSWDIAAPTNDSSCVCLSLTVMCLCLCLCVCLCVCVCEIWDDGDSASGDKATTVWPNVEKSTTEKITAMQAGDEETFNNHHIIGSIIAKFVSCHERS